LIPVELPDAFSLAGEGDGGVAGFAKGGADVELVADGDKTILRYSAKAETGGKLGATRGAIDYGHCKKTVKNVFRKIREDYER
jgi:carbon monoxide dehydrogenase subunit G